MNKRTLITAHSGADGTPENSIAFVRYALTTDADAFEVDVRREKDGTLVLSHDALCGEHYPTLHEALMLLKKHPSMKINCDLKEPGLEAAVLKLAEQMQLSDRLIFSGTVNYERVQQLDAQDKVKIYANIEEQIPEMYQRYREGNYDLALAEQVCVVYRKKGIQVINVNERLVTQNFWEILSENGIKLSVWTVNDENEITKMLRYGVYNITTRNLSAALLLRDRYRSSDGGML